MESCRDPYGSSCCHTMQGRTTHFVLTVELKKNLCPVENIPNKANSDPVSSIPTCGFSLDREWEIKMKTAQSTACLRN